MAGLAGRMLKSSDGTDNVFQQCVVKTTVFGCPFDWYGKLIHVKPCSVEFSRFILLSVVCY